MKEPSRPTYKRLFAVSGNRCPFPGCKVTIIDAASGQVIGEICHIHAQHARGARYDPRLSDQEVHAFENLMLMCPTHHTMVDRDEKTYPVERLRQMKAQHEAKYANGQMPSDEVVESLRRADKQSRVVELRRPPDAILEHLKSKQIRRLSRTSKLMIAVAVFYLAWFGVDVWYMSTVGPNDWSALNMLPSPAFLLLTVGFSHWAFVYHKRKIMTENEPQLMSKERYPVRDLMLEADYDQVVDRCVDALRSTGAKIFELVRENADHAVIYAMRESGSFWSRFTPSGLSLDEIVIVITSEDVGKCRISVETSVDDKSNGSIYYVTKFLERLTKRN